MLLSPPITSYRQQLHTICHPATMFRHLCLLAVAFLAVSDATNHIKDSKPCSGNGLLATRGGRLYSCTPPGPPGGAILTVTQGILFDCDDETPVGDDFFGVLSLTCTGLWDGTVAGTPDAALQCSGIITVNTEGNKQAKKDFSSIAFTAQGPLDVISLPPPALSATIGPATGLVITGSNGAWGKSDNIKDITFTPVAGTALSGVYEIVIEYKTRGFNPV